MEGSSNPFLSASARIQDFEYFYASNTNVSDIVSVKLSGNSNYLLWKAQMLCLLQSTNMYGIVDATFAGPRDSTMKQYDSLVRGWIFGSITEDVLVGVFDLGSAKDVWEKLKSMYDSAGFLRQDSTSNKSETQTMDEEDANSIKIDEENPYIASEETNTFKEGITMNEDIVSSETQKRDEHMQESEDKIEQKKKILLATTKGDWSEATTLLINHPDLANEAISKDGSTILHIAVGIGHNRIVKYLIQKLSVQDVLKKRESDGSTSLHIAAIVGNINAAELLVKKNPMLLQTIDSNGKVPLYKAYEYMHLVTIEYLFQAISDDAKTELQSSLPGSTQPGEEIAVELLANAISAKQYRLAFVLVQRFPKVASKSDDVLMALAKTFPSGLDYAEALIYPSHDYLTTIFYTADWIIFDLVLDYLAPIEYFHRCSDNVIYKVLITIVLAAVPIMLILVVILMVIITVFVCVIFNTFYSIWWNVAKILIPPIKRIDDKQKEWDAAIQLLEFVCDEIDKSKYPAGTDHHPYYTRPVLEAACQNAYKVVDEILFRAPETILRVDKSGHDIIQLAILNRSEKIYNLIYDIRERKNFYRKYEDSFQNNMLHLAGKLAPSSVLNQRTGAALQLQRELQWREEIKKLVVPTYITQENVFNQTPDMIFTREHEGLVKEGEKWMKTAAESCSITAALITTIVFAAAITVPGGSNQEGMPIKKHKDAFVIFAISDAISLFASTTALLVFLSILTTRFAEKDFLVSLPRRLFIGLFSLLLSTTAMMIAFSATLYLVFGDERSWMLAPISALAIIPISFFVGLQFPLMVDLFRSTYLGIFGKQRKSVSRKFNLTDLQSLGTNTKRSINRALSIEKSKNDQEDIQLKQQPMNYVKL